MNKPEGYRRAMSHPDKEKLTRERDARFADELRQGGIAEGLLGRVGLRSLVRMWFNPATGHFVADAIGCLMWSETVAGPWHIVPNSTPAGRLALNRSGEKP